MNPSSIATSRIPRRDFLGSLGTGVAGIALGQLLGRDGLAEGWRPPTGQPHFAPKAKSVIWLFMIGGASHLETFDPKPELNKHAGKSVKETPHKGVLESPFLANERVVIPDVNGQIRNTLYPLQIGYKQRGDSGIEISDWLPKIGDCADDLCVIRSMWTEDSNHGAQLQFHTGRHRLDGYTPTIGSWVHYGLGALNENLPQFVVLGEPLADCCGGNEGHGADYLGPRHAGVRLKVDPKDPLPFAAPGSGYYREEQRAEFELLSKLNRQAADEYPNDPALEARIKSYELAYRMQMAVPDAFRFEEETPATHDLYGKGEFANVCLGARRLVERGVRFVQVYHGGTGNAGAWDSHSGLKTNHSRLCAQTDQPIAALLKDLKQRGLLDETLVVWATEFGRTPGSQSNDGRDHHPYGFSIFMAGGGVKGGHVHGATDEIGFHAVEHRHYVTDVHATVLKLMGLDSRRLEIPGRKRLERDHGEPIDEIIA
ncbi:MAG: DUF1501 domain-containing protein [Planctomycetaceae bacterium]